MYTKRNLTTVSQTFLLQAQRRFWEVTINLFNLLTSRLCFKFGLNFIHIVYFAIKFIITPLFPVLYFKQPCFYFTKWLSKSNYRFLFTGLFSEYCRTGARCSHSRLIYMHVLVCWQTTSLRFSDSVAIWSWSRLSELATKHFSRAVWRSGRYLLLVSALRSSSPWLLKCVAAFLNVFAFMFVRVIVVVLLFFMYFL